jgi:bile acid-coenzyme A ligase
MPTVDMSLPTIFKLLEESPIEPFVESLARLTAEDPGFIAIVCEDDRITRGELDARTSAMARAYADLGVSEGDFVTIGLSNGIDWFVSFIACLKLGATPQPISSKLPVAERQAIIELAESTLVVGADPADHPGRTCIPADYHPSPEVSSDPLPAVVSPAWKAPTSGGSTGRPKLIVSGDSAMGSPLLNGAIYLFSPEDVQAVAGPLYHNAPMSHAMLGLLQGQRLVVMKRFDAERMLELIAAERITWLQLVPTMMHRLHRAIEGGAEHDLSSVRVLWHMAAKCPDWLKEAWIERIGADRVMELYGGTESQAMTVISGEEWLKHRGSVGRPVVGEMTILDEDGKTVGADTPGEIYLRRPEGMGKGYRYIGAEAHERDGWESLGDLGWMDADGYVYIGDRRVDMIVSGGANIFPAEVEAALDAHPEVQSSIVVGIPDDDLGERVHALVQAAPSTTAEGLLSFLETRLVRYKIPRTIELVDVPLRDDAGKARRVALRDETVERLAAGA